MTLESVPLGGEAPRVYPSSIESLRGVQFNSTDGNKLTAENIERAAQVGKQFLEASYALA